MSDLSTPFYTMHIINTFVILYIVNVCVFRFCPFLSFNRGGDTRKFVFDVALLESFSRARLRCNT